MRQLRSPPLGRPGPGPETVTADPFNAETARDAIGEPLTDPAAFFVRNHFATPRLDVPAWRLRVDGAVRRPVTLTYRQLSDLATAEVEAVLECAGNGRARMRPRPPGVPWGQRAAGCAHFVGTPLRAVLDHAGLDRSACEIVFAGADGFERSLAVADAVHPGVLLAGEMGGAPLTPDHGAPVRLVVPGWYGVASVKWLTHITAVTTPFRGRFQTEYVYRRPDDSAVTPVQRLRVQSLISSPREGAVLPRGPVTITGHAWSGEAPVERVEVSIDGGASWLGAQVRPATPAGCGWSHWSFTAAAPEPGRLRVQARATDRLGHVQPSSAEWNALGFGNNAVSAIEITMV
ncbi:sulfite oxidase [Rhodococcus sp. NPDC058514]|uniref:sulfite oxidase n=1 Tax=unclassified Rhodococcus (in: high G+C Gram-positive bacteria) TaxID=192944 RepID=UPI003663C927